MKDVDLVIIGGGPAGMAAAVSAYNSGVRDILILERDEHLGGILQQCVHNGFGLHKFGEELTGPEYAYKYEKLVNDLQIPYELKATVINVTEDKIITYVSPKDGEVKLKAQAIILAMGCRERPRGALNTPGTRPAGVYSAGTVQRFVNKKGYLPGKNVVILGSGDIGLIMARRLTLEGCKVLAVCELMPYSSGLNRNIVQCLNDFDIPLLLSHTVVQIHGEKRVTGVTIAEVDDKRQPVPGTEEYIACDTLLLSCGLLPENELTKGANVNLDRITGGAIVDNKRETMVPGIYSCGNVLHVHDLVDYVSEESEIAGKYAAIQILNKDIKTISPVTVTPKGLARYAVPQRITTWDSDVKIFFRVSNTEKNVVIKVTCNNETILTKKRPKVAPGEMENIIIKADLLEKLSGQEIIISCEKEENL